MEGLHRWMNGGKAKALTARTRGFLIFGLSSKVASYERANRCQTKIFLRTDRKCDDCKPSTMDKDIIIIMKR